MMMPTTVLTSGSASAPSGVDTLPGGSLIIGGKEVADSSAGRLDHVNPATGRAQASFVIAGPPEVDQAVAAARDALPRWSGLHAGARRNLMLTLADVVERNAERLGMVAALENGTPIAFGAQSSGRGPADYLRYYAGWVDKLEGRTIPSYPDDALNYTVPEPWGVVAMLTAYNAPMTFVGFKVSAALAAGNTCVIKPSELAPWTTLLFAELCLEAGIPPGVVNVVCGDAATGDLLVRHPDVAKVSFTGGVGTARAILRAASDNITPVSLELGGKSANVVFADADLDTAIPIAWRTGMVLRSGQACVAPTRLLVERPVYSQVVDAVVAAAEKVLIGDPLDPATVMGPVISERHAQRIVGVVEEAEHAGAGRLLTGGGRLGGDLAEGYYIPPTVFSDVDPTSRLAQQEIFGPVLSIIPFDGEDEAVRIANATTYGLAGYVFTSDITRAHRMVRRIDAGYISVNSFNPFPPNAPFGGFRQSGMGKEGGLEGLLEMTRVKNAYLRLS